MDNAPLRPSTCRYGGDVWVKGLIAYVTNF